MNFSGLFALAYRLKREVRGCEIHPLYSPMKTLLTEQTTADDKMITSSWSLLSSQPAGGRNVFCGAVAVRR